MCVSECEGERGQLLVSCTCMLLENEKGEKIFICFYVCEIRREKLKAFHSQSLDD